MKEYNIRIIGIDPGLEITGVGILDVKGSSYIPIYCSCIITNRNKSISDRLKKIYSSVNELILKYSPDCLAIEDIFFSSNAKTAINVGQARGVCILAGSKNNLKVHEYTPLQIKQAIVGYGRATKRQIKYMVKIILSLKDGVRDKISPKKDDAWDAMAIAICHANSFKFQDKVKVLME